MEDSGARASKASLEIAGEAPAAGYELFADVIVRLSGPSAGPDAERDAMARLAAALSAKFGVARDRAAAAAADWTFKPLVRSTANAAEPLPGFFVVRAASIARASEAARFLAAQPAVGEAYVNIAEPIALRLPPDPGFSLQWHLYNSEDPLRDINAETAWNNGYTGTGVTVGVLEGGWYKLHPDLSVKYSTAASQADQGFSSHGTAVAGLVGAQAFNGQGGVGVAYGAQLSNLYYFGGSSGIATAFLHRNDLNAIKTNSWGPADNGRISFLSSAEAAALEDASINGRGGLGTVFIWAGGNGAASNDRVDYDAYASNRRVIAVGAIDIEDRRSLYSEPGSSLMLVAPSDYFTGSPAGIYTCDGLSTYTSGFGGTSAAAPIAAGVVALALQANPSLTWRDVQHVLINSARHCDPANPSWQFNAAGRAISYDFGFGAIDAGAACTLAASWINVPPEASATAGPVLLNLPIPDNAPMSVGGGITVSMPVSANLLLERVQVVLTAPHQRVGNLRVELEGPSGTRSLVAAPRNDTTAGAYNAYVFTSVRYWGERSPGEWTLRISDEQAGNFGTLTGWELRFFGTTPACPCDWDHSGVVDADDLFAFLGAWFIGAGDFDGSDVCDADDIFAFLSCWFSLGFGCDP